MISICDLNAKVCKEKSWRHLVQPVNAIGAGNSENLSNFNSIRDPFRICDQNIRMVKLIQYQGSMPRILVLFYSNVAAILTRNAIMNWEYT